MNRILTLLMVSLTSLSLCFAQNQFYGTWYQMDQSEEGSRERMVLSNNKMVSERLQTYEVETPYWEIDKESIIEESKMVNQSWQVTGLFKEAYFGGEIWLGANNGELMVYQMRAPCNSVEDAYNKLDDNKFKELMARTFYSKERLTEIQKMPSLSAISKEDLIRTIEHVQSYRDQLNEFVNENKDSRMRFFVGRIAENLRDRKFIELGYHPYKWEEGQVYYSEKFKNDPDLQKLNEASMHLKIF